MLIVSFDDNLESYRYCGKLNLFADKNIFLKICSPKHFLKTVEKLQNFHRFRSLQRW